MSQKKQRPGCRRGITHIKSALNLPKIAGVVNSIEFHLPLIGGRHAQRREGGNHE